MLSNRQNLQQITDNGVGVPSDAVITILKDWRIQVGVYRNDTLTVFHAGQMLDSSGDAEGQIHFGMDEAAGLADLF